MLSVSGVVGRETLWFSEAIMYAETQTRIRLSEVSAQVTAALSMLDGARLRELTERLNRVAFGVEEGTAAGCPGVEPEPAESVERELQVLGEVLVATEENIHLLQRLQERKARQEWAL